MGSAWVGASPQSKYGGALIKDDCGPGAAESPLGSVAGPRPGRDGKPWHWDSPLFIVGVLVVLVTGFGGASTTARVRVGPVSAGGGVAAGSA
jgi:hypothetical protein